MIMMTKHKKITTYIMVCNTIIIYKYITLTAMFVAGK